MACGGGGLSADSAWCVAGVCDDESAGNFKSAESICVRSYGGYARSGIYDDVNEWSTRYACLLGPRSRARVVWSLCKSLAHVVWVGPGEECCHALENRSEVDVV